MIWVNFKSYEAGWTERGIKLSLSCGKISRETGVKIIPVVSALSFGFIKQAYQGEMWIQHADWEKEGGNSGAVLIREAIGAGAAGSLINHSEKKLKLGTIKKTLAAKPAGFQIMTICQHPKQITGWGAKLNTDYLAWEPTELIGSSEESVMDKYEETVKKLAAAVRVPLIIGAGIKKGEDVRRALAAGAKGVLVSSDVVKAADPEKELKELALNFRT
jgi:triosephosphate isomerase